MRRSRSGGGRRGCGVESLPAQPVTPPGSPRHPPGRTLTPCSGASTPTHVVCQRLQTPRTPSTPVMGGSGGGARQRCRSRIGAEATGAIPAHTPSVSTKRYAADSGARARGTGGRTRSGKKRRRRRPVRDIRHGLLDFDGKSADEEYKRQ